jgi:putative ABC transport system permease protein
MLYMFTTENFKQYAVLKAMGATPRLLLTMIFTQAGVCALLATEFGLGLCGVIGHMALDAGYPFRMMWITPLIGTGDNPSRERDSGGDQRPSGNTA